MTIIDTRVGNCVKLTQTKDKGLEVLFMTNLYNSISFRNPLSRKIKIFQNVHLLPKQKYAIFARFATFFHNFVYLVLVLMVFLPKLDENRKYFGVEQQLFAI